MFCRKIDIPGPVPSDGPPHTHTHTNTEYLVAWFKGAPAIRGNYVEVRSRHSSLAYAPRDTNKRDGETRGGSSICPGGSHIPCFGALVLARPAAHNHQEKKIDSLGTQSQALKFAKAFHKQSYATSLVWRSRRGAAARRSAGGAAHLGNTAKDGDRSEIHDDKQEQKTQTKLRQTTESN